MLAVDGPNYIRGALEIVDHGRPWLPRDIHHSPGYQAYLAQLLRAARSLPGLIALSKAVSLTLFFAATWLTYRLGRVWFSPGAGILAAWVFSASPAWVYYSNMIQYEVPSGFLLLSWLILAARRRGTSRPRRPCWPGPSSRRCTRGISSSSWRVPASGSAWGTT